MPILEIPRRLLPLLLLLLFSTFASGQDYYWVDSEGNKHYDDRVVPNDQRWDAERLRDSTPHRPESYRQPNSQSDRCAAQWAAYERSAACFARCRTPKGNVANCGHCRNMTRPNC